MSTESFALFLEEVKMCFIVKDGSSRLSYAAVFTEYICMRAKLKNARKRNIKEEVLLTEHIYLYNN